MLDEWISFFYKIKQNFLFLCSHSDFYTEHWAVPAMWQNCRRVNFFLRAFLLLGIRSQTLKQSVRTLFGFTFGFPPIKYPRSKIPQPSFPKSPKTSPYHIRSCDSQPNPPQTSKFHPVCPLHPLNLFHPSSTSSPSSSSCPSSPSTHSSLFHPWTPKQRSLVY